MAIRLSSMLVSLSKRTEKDSRENINMSALTVTMKSPRGVSLSNFKKYQRSSSMYALIKTYILINF